MAKHTTRDTEISRLIKYAEGLGLKTIFKKLKDGGAAAEWTLDGQEMTIYTWKNQSKLELILAMVHELGHHVWFVKERNRVQDKKFEAAIDAADLAEEDGTETPENKRRKILNVELAGMAHWEDIYRDVNLSFPLKRLYLERDVDTFMYRYYYEYGEFPTQTEKRKKFKELRKKYYG